MALNSNDIADMAMERLKTNKDKPIMFIYDWFLTQVKTQWLEDGFKIFGLTKSGNDVLRIETAVIATADFTTGLAEDISGQKYRLGAANEKYMQALQTHNPDLALKLEKLALDPEVIIS
jgi:hypothetical protein